MDDDGTISPPTSAKASALILDTIAAILSDTEESQGWVPVKGLLIYVYMKDDGKEVVNSFGTDGIWSTEAIGLCEVAKHDLLIGGEENREDDA